MNDSIVEEVRRVREAHAAQFGHDLDAIFRDIKRQEKSSGLTFVSFDRNGSPDSRALEPALGPCTEAPSALA